MGYSRSCAMGSRRISGERRSVTVTRAPRRAKKRAEASPPPWMPSPMTVTRMPGIAARSVFNAELSHLRVVQVGVHAYVFPLVVPCRRDIPFQLLEEGHVLGKARVLHLRLDSVHGRRQKLQRAVQAGDCSGAPLRRKGDQAPADCLVFALIRVVRIGLHARGQEKL